MEPAERRTETGSRDRLADRQRTGERGLCVFLTAREAPYWTPVRAVHRRRIAAVTNRFVGQVT